MERFICLICAVFGYCMGMFQTAYIYGRLHGINIKKEGSGNAGTTNMIRVMGLKAGIITFIGDLAKVFIAIALAKLIVNNVLGFGIDSYALTLYTGIGTVLGHDYPAYLKFDGGKGVAASVAVCTSFWDWKMFLFGFCVFMIIAFITKYVSLASMTLMVSLAAYLIVSTQVGWVYVEPKWLPDCYIIIIFMAALVIFQHRANIARLLSGTENKFSFKSSKK